MAKKSPRVEILTMTPQEHVRVRAILSLKLTTPVGEFVFHDCRVIRDHPGESIWVSPPQEMRAGRHHTLCCWPAEVRKAINLAVRGHFLMQEGGVA